MGKSMSCFEPHKGFQSQALTTRLFVDEVTISYRCASPERVKSTLIFAWIDGSMQVYSEKMQHIGKLISILKHRESHDRL